MSQPSLALYTAAGSNHAKNTELIDLLKSIELIGKSIATSEYLAGPHFFNHIVFLGCAPNISIDPDQGPQHIRITVHTLSKPKLFSSSRAPAPLCPSCKQAMEYWKDHINATENGEISCPQCKISTPVRRLNFRKRACFSRHIIRIAPVYESEAIPADGLIDTLSQAFNARFSYAFIS